MITIFINNDEIKTKLGANLLWTALDNNVYIPNLCAVESKIRQHTSCRLCFVEIDGNPLPVTACTIIAKEGMKVYIDTPKIKKIRNTAFKFLLSNHNLDCINCPKHKNCELQNIALKLGLKLKDSKYRPITKNIPIDYSHLQFYFDRSRCILCGKCVWICNEIGNGTLDFAFRGINTVVTTFNSLPLNEAKCDSCLACVAVCPVASLVAKEGVSLSGIENLIIQKFKNYRF